MKQSNIILVILILLVLSIEVYLNDSGLTNATTEVTRNSSQNFEERVEIPGVAGAFAICATDDKGGIFVAYQSHWTENDNETSCSHIYFSYSHDFGESWSQSFRINDNESVSVWCDSPNIAVDNSTGTIYIAWKDNRTGVAKVYVDKSIDRGITFSSDTEVYNWLNDSIPPWLPYTVNIEVGSNGTVFIAWVMYNSNSYSDCNIMFVFSEDEGQTFSTPIIIDEQETDVRLAFPWIVFDNENNIFVAYTSRTAISAKVCISKSIDNGLSFGTPVRITDVTTQHYCGGIKTSVSGDGKIHAVWTDSRAGVGTEFLDIYYASSSDGGQTFETNIKVNDDTEVVAPTDHIHFTRGAQGTPCIVTDSNLKIHIVWEDFRNYESYNGYSRDIYYSASDDSTTFSENIKANTIHPDASTVDCADPNIIIDSEDNIFMVYSDTQTGDLYHHNIYFQSLMRKEINDKTSTTTSTTVPLSINFGIELLIFTFLILIVFIQRRWINFLKRGEDF